MTLVSLLALIVAMFVVYGIIGMCVREWWIEQDRILQLRPPPTKPTGRCPFSGRTREEVIRAQNELRAGEEN